jgi:chromosome partitioning protein
MVEPYIIVLGNEKGGSGKTTTAMHLIFSLIHKGYKVSCMDLDIRQLSLKRYLENRDHYRNKNVEFSKKYPMPNFINPDEERMKSQDSGEIVSYFMELFADLNSDFIVIDTPGSNSLISTVAHSFADLIVTPINDSFIDMDLLATIVGDDLRAMKPNIYSAMVWEQKVVHFKRHKRRAEWVVIRNRLSNLDSNNRRNVDKILNHLSKNLAFRICCGFSERIIYRELFPYGLTLLDIFDNQSLIKITASHIAARQELRNFINDLRIPILMRDNFNEKEEVSLQDRIVELRNKIGSSADSVA